jgi:hypothetical protein
MENTADTGIAPTDSIEERFAALLEIEDTPPSASGSEAPSTPSTKQADDVEESPVEDEEDEEPESDEAAEVEQGEEPEGEPEPEEDPAQDLFVVTIDGKESEVAAEELVKGYQRQQDYSRKTAALSEERNAFESERVEVQQERARYAEVLDKLEDLVSKGLEEEPDWEKLRREDPTSYVMRREEWRERKEKLAAVQQEKAAVQEKQKGEHAQVLRKHVESERTKLVEALPDWGDPSKAAQEQQALAQYGQQVGFSSEELAQVVDHRAVLILRKAMLYDQLQGKKTAIRKKAKGAPVLKPGAKQRPKRKQSDSVRAREQLKQSGSMGAAKDAFLAILGD